MRARVVRNKVVRWVKSYGFVPEHDVKIKSSGDQEVVFFEINTTKTRASSIATRLRLILSDISDQPVVHVSLIGEPPKNRAAVSLWRISTEIRKKNA